MPFSSSSITYIIILANVIFSYQGFKDMNFLDKNVFRVGSILKNKEYKRLISSGFLHGNWSHLIFNMFSLYSFGTSLEAYFGTFFFCCVYFGSLIGGDLLSLFIHRNEPNYSAIGASGAVNGIIFSSILLFPDMKVQMFFIPIGIPSWAFAIMYTLYTIYGIRAQNDNTGHDAHLGGALIGTLTSIGFFPELLEQNLLLVTLILVPTSIFMYVLILHPHLVNSGVAEKKKPNVRLDDHYNQIRAEKQKEMDRILDKISKEGMESLNDYEKRFLNMNK